MNDIAAMQAISLPHPNTYALPPSRLLAGEYPFTPNRDEAQEKLRAFLDAGIDFFVDLTGDGELKPYDAVLQEECARRGLMTEYVRLPIRDMQVPTEARMREILDTIDKALETGRTVYVHCWGGVGRTGTVVGCYLVRRGASGKEALGQVASFFESMSEDKVRRHPEGSPQTEAQRAFVRGWIEPTAA